MELDIHAMPRHLWVSPRMQSHSRSRSIAPCHRGPALRLQRVFELLFSTNRAEMGHFHIHSQVLYVSILGIVCLWLPTMGDFCASLSRDSVGRWRSCLGDCP